MTFKHVDNEVTAKRFRRAEDRPDLRDELSNNSELRKYMEVSERMNGARLNKSNDPKRDEWVFWQKEHDESSG